MKFQLGEILPRIYHLSFESGYDLAMHFVRVQEFYESPKFFQKIFTLVDFMEWYAKEKGKGAFTYPTDWSGFNVPSKALLSVYGPLTEIPDPNRYDELMRLLVQQMYRDAEGRDFYLIGTSKAGYQGDGDEAGVLSHEIAHGLFYTDREYEKGARRLLSKMDGETRQQIRQVLLGMGYHTSTVDDEIHAYCSTGPCRELESLLTDEVCTPFVEHFERVSGEHFARRLDK